jgi:hypothetical protein
MNCDLCGESNEDEVGLIKDGTKSRCREIAKKNGWIVRDGKDVCPICAESEGED